MKNTNTTEEVEDLLSFDALAFAEKLTNKSYKESDSTSKLGMALHIGHSAIKSERLKGLGDTHFRMTLEECEGIIKELGFVEIHKHEFKDTSWENVKTESFRVYYNPSHFSLIKLESYDNQKTINSVDMYFTLEIGSEENIFDFSRGCSVSSHQSNTYDNASNRKYNLQYDGREGLVNKFNTVKDRLVDWSPKEMKFLWFIDFSQTKVEGYDRNSINNKVIKSFPQTVVDRMGWEVY